MNIAIYEDDRDYAMLLERHISRHTHFPTSINTGSRLAIEKYIKEKKEATLFFLDIILQGEDSGFAVAEMIAEQKRGDLIVFMTSNTEKIIANPFHKTIAFNIIFKNSDSLMQEVADTITLARESLANTCLLHAVSKTENLYIPFDGILFIEYLKGSSKVLIKCINAEFTIRGTLSKIHEKLDSRFVRCHKSYVVNSTKVVKLDKTAKKVHLINGVECPYSLFMKSGLIRKLDEIVLASK